MNFKSMVTVMALVLGVVSACFGQGDRGLISGIVRDTSNAVVPGVAVRLTNTATGVSLQTTSNEEGAYTVEYVAPGEYTLSAQREGFKRFERPGVTVRVNDRLAVDVVLDLGQLTETVTVSAGAVLLETASSSIGTVVDNRRLMDLPMLYGNPFTLQYVTPGVADVTGSGSRQHPYDSGTADVSINGSQQQSNEFTLDGMANTRKRVSAFTPSVEFIQEYKVETATYDASQGHATGGWVNVSLKSGTNKPHGSGYYYFQRPSMNANAWARNKGGQPRPEYRFWRYGGTMGGPIRKDRTFWFVGHEQMAHDTQGSDVLTVPTPEDKKGDFSRFLKLGSRYQLYDPMTTQDLGTGRLSRQPLPNNIVPSSRFDPIGVKLLSYYASPNQPGTADDGNNFIATTMSPDRYWALSTRVDHMLTDRQRLFGRVVASTRHQGPYRYFWPVATGNHLYYKNRPGAILDYVYTLGSQTVLNAHYGVTRFTSAHYPVALGFDFTQLGLPGSLKNSISSKVVGFPNVRPSGYEVLNREGAGDESFNDIHSLYGSVSMTRSRHIIRLGADVREYCVNQSSYGQGSGRYDFGGYMNGPFDNSTAAPRGTGVAGMLLGVLSGGSLDINDNFAAITRYASFYVQDDWKVSARLTVNLGLRYEYEGPILERFNRSVRSFDFTSPSPVEPTAIANYAKTPIPEVPVSQFKVKGGLLFAGLNSEPRALWRSPARNFAPRVGLAFSVDRRTVLRAGYGIHFDQMGVTDRNPIQTGFSQSTSIVPSLDNGVTFRAKMANPFPDGLLKPRGASDGLATYLGRGVSFFLPNPRTPYTQRWSLGVQRQIAGEILVDVSYVGSRSTALPIGRAHNPIPSRYLSTSPVRDQVVIDALSKKVANPFYPLLPGTALAAATVSVSNLLKPYPQFGDISADNHQGYSWYHSMQTRVQRRFSEGYTVMASFTWSKNMEAIGFLNSTDPTPYETISENDRTKRLAMNGIYELPFGKGKRWGAVTTGLVERLISGWQIQGVYQVQTGALLGFGNVIFNGDPKTIKLPAAQRTPDRWFNTDAGFERDSRKTLDRNIRTFPLRFSGLRADFINFLDASIIKRTTIKERITGEFRVECVNLMNTPAYGGPDTSPTSTGFGTISSAQGSRTLQLGFVGRF